MDTEAGETARNLSLKPAARRIGVSPFTLRAWSIYQGRIAFIRLGRRVLFATTDLDAFVARHRIAARYEDPQSRPGGRGELGKAVAARGAPLGGREKNAKS